VKRPIIGITCGTEYDSNQQAVADRLPRSYVRAVLAAGGAPLAIPNLKESETDALLDILDGLILSGGRDIAPSLYGSAEAHPSVELDHDRDTRELPLIRTAIEMDLPILAICRGVQSLNVALGGTLYQDLPTDRPSAVAHRQDAARDAATHSIAVHDASLLTRSLGATELRVNSFHHQAVRQPAAALTVVGWAEDGLIEAVEMEGRRFVVGVQYHPEEMVGVCGASRQLFGALIAACG